MSSDAAARGSTLAQLECEITRASGSPEIVCARGTNESAINSGMEGGLMGQHDARSRDTITTTPRRFRVLAVLAVCYLFSTSSSVIHADSATLATRGDHDRGLSFVARQDFDVSGDPRSVAQGDLNGDGVLDLATANYSDGTISILLGRGDGTFGPETRVPAGRNPTALVIGRFNDDRDLDIAVTNPDDGTITLLFGRGRARFAPATVVHAGPRLGPLAAADFNGDGVLDLAVINGVFAPSCPSDCPVPIPGFVTILLGQRNGTFDHTAFVEIPLGNGAPISLTTADFDRDGHQDLAVVTTRGVVTMLLGLGDGAFQTQTVPVVSGRSIPAAAMAVDGHVVYLAMLSFVPGTSNLPTVEVFLNRGDGTFRESSTITPVGFEPGAVSFMAFADVNGDRRPDLVATNWFDATVSIALGVGDGTFNLQPAVPVGGRPWAAIAGDFDSDGRVDVATANRAGTVSILLGEGRGRFESAASQPVDCCPESIVTGDFDHDGVPDLVTANFVTGTLSVLRGRRDGRFRSTVSFTPPALPNQLAVGDFNGDTHLDLAMTNLADGGGPGNAVFILLGRGDGSFQAGASMAVDSPAGIVTGDFNADGRADLAVTSDYGRSVTSFLGVGDGTFVRGQVVAVGPDPGAMATADVNGDGQLDLVVANRNRNGMSDPGSISILLGRGDGTFQALPEATAGVEPFSLAAGDLNHDGHADLAILNVPVTNGIKRDPNMVIWLGRGDGTFVEAASPPSVAGVSDVMMADFDADGHPDLAGANGGNFVEILLGNGDGTFRLELLAGVGSDPRASVVGDFNGDGLPDVAVANYTGYAGSVSILLSDSLRRGPRRDAQHP
ncbi:MAG: VCBS repeat-containing protein [Acidobacteriota bacterium]